MTLASKYDAHVRARVILLGDKVRTLRELRRQLQDEITNVENELDRLINQFRQDARRQAKERQGIIPVRQVRRRDGTMCGCVAPVDDGAIRYCYLKQHHASTHVARVKGNKQLRWGVSKDNVWITPGMTTHEAVSRATARYKSAPHPGLDQPPT